MRQRILPTQTKYPLELTTIDNLIDNNCLKINLTSTKPSAPLPRLYTIHLTLYTCRSAALQLRCHLHRQPPCTIGVEVGGIPKICVTAPALIIQDLHTIILC